MKIKILIIAYLMMMTTVFSGCDLLGGDENNKDNCIERGHPCEKHIECFTDSEYQKAVKYCEQIGMPIHEGSDGASDLEDENNDDEEEVVEEGFTEEGLVVYYPFDEDIKDYAGDEIDATNHNAYFVDGKKGKALKFNGRNSYIHVPLNINPIPMPQVTMTAWVKAEKGSVVVRQVMGNENNNNEHNRSMGTDFRGGGKGWSCFAGSDKVLGYEPVVANKWTFIAVVYDQNAETVKLFIDGSVHEKDGVLTDGNDFILIGAQGSDEKQSHPFNGSIDEVKIYDYALSDTELNSLYKTGIAKPKTNN